MQDNDEHQQLITPQVKPAETQHVPTKEELAAEKKRRIDAALEHYTALLSQPGESITVAAAADQQQSLPHHEASPSHPENQHKDAELPHTKKQRETDAQFIAAHMDEVREVLDKMMSRHEEPAVREETRGEVIAPTEADPDATVALAIAELRRRQEEEAVEAARRAEEDARPTNRYKNEPVVDFMPKLPNKKRFFTLIALWLAAIPLAIIINVIVSKLGDNIFANGLLVIVYLLGAYGTLGWIPVVVSYIRNSL